VKITPILGFFSLSLISLLKASHIVFCPTEPFFHSKIMIGAQRNENTLVKHKCIFKTESYLLLARVDRMEAVLSSPLLVLTTAAAVPWAVWQEAG
jgi:hypothetical protein